ncbi:MAG: hypothetical protein WD011_00860 [Nitriliruptoraceae bacterium]
MGTLVTSLLQTVHPWLGYIMVAALLVAAAVAFNRAKYAREYRPGVFVLVMVAVDVQVLLGLLIYGLTSSWESRPEIAYLHPLVGLVALGAGHAALRRARNEQMAVDANRAAGRGMLATLVLILIAIGIASAPAFL